MNVITYSHSSDRKRIFKAFVLLDIERDVVQILKTSLDVYFEKLPSGKPPDLYVIEFNNKCHPGSIYRYLYKRLKAPVLIILDPEPLARHYSALNMYNPRNITGYLLKSSLPTLLNEAVESICQNNYYCDPEIKQIKIPKRL